MKILFFDTEINNFRQTRIIQLAWHLVNYKEMETLYRGEFLIKPNGWVIPEEPFWIEHGFNTQKSYREGYAIETVIDLFMPSANDADIVVTHNIPFDFRVLEGELLRLGTNFPPIPRICTMSASKDHCRIPLKGKNGYKPPKLDELYFFLFNKPMKGAHNAGYDVDACMLSFFELVKRGVIKLPIPA